MSRRRVVLLLVCCGLLAGGFDRLAAGQDAYDRWMRQFFQLRDADRKIEAERTLRQAIAVARQQGNAQRLIEALKYRAIVLIPLGHYDEAQASIVEAMALATKHFPGNQGVLMQVEYVVGWVAQFRGEYAEAEASYLRAIQMAENLRPPNRGTARLVRTFLGQVYQAQGRYAECERLMLELLPGARADGDPVLVLLTLGEVAIGQGKLHRAEQYYREAWSVSARINGRDDSVTASVETGMSRVYSLQFRWNVAKQMLDHAIPILERVSGPDSMELADALLSRARCIHMLGDAVGALADMERALAIQERAYEPDHPELSDSVKILGYSYFLNGEHEKAERLLRRAVVLAEGDGGATMQGGMLVEALVSLARVLGETGRWDEAGAVVERAVDLEQAWPVPWANRMEMWLVLAESLWRRGRQEEALAAVERSMESAELQRSQTSLSDTGRAHFFATFSECFEKKVEWEIARGNLGAAFATMERMRARAFLEELALSDRGVMQSGSEADRRREVELKTEITRLEQQLDLAADEGARVEISEALHYSQNLLANHWKEVRNADPVYRELISSGKQEFAGVEEVREVLLGERDVMLAYSFGHFGGYVAVITQKAMELRPIVLDEAQAETLGVAAGPLVDLRLREMMMNGKGDGIVERLADSARAAEVVPELAALWEVLIPAEVREDLIGGAYARLVVLPDGALSFLPLEALVVETADEEVRYLLDAGPPVMYGPSATVMLNLARRSDDKGIEETPLLTLGDPAYRLAASGSSTRANTRLNLTRLPYSGRESQWVKEVFGKQGVEAVQLLGAEATEGKLRQAIAGRELVHLACHGMSDNALGNLFGALALAPGQEADNPENDGLLTLAEIYQLDLNACELAILSACVTNYGPQNQGEGTWSLSRGFWWRGRGVASNWVVDDEAGASLISYFCSAIAQARERGEAPDYAKCLQDAKRWIRKQQKWTSPFFWATFSLVGRH